MQIILKPRFWIIWSWLLVSLCLIASLRSVAIGDWLSAITSLTSLSANLALIAFWKNRS